MYKIGLVVLNYNSSDDTLKCVSQLLSFERDYHIIIVDNNSPDGSAEIISKEFSGVEHVDVICNKNNLGYSAGNNLGIKYAISNYDVDIVGVLNPDVIIPNKDVIEKIADVLMSDSGYAIAGGVAITAEREYKISNSCWNIPTAKEIVWNHFLLNKGKKPLEKLKMCANNVALTECIAGCFFMAKASVIDELGYLDENVFLYNEENILGIKCRNKGYKEVIVLDQFYIHNHIWKNDRKKSLKAKLKTVDLGYESRKYLCEKYYDKKLLPLLRMVQVANRLVISIGALKHLMK